MPVPLIPKSDNRGREEEPLRCSLQPSSPWSVATPTSYLRSNSSSLEGRNLGFGPARGFPLPLLEPLTEILLLHGVELCRVDEDIRLYPRGKLNATTKLRSGLGLSNPWPCNEDLNILTKKSQGLFIFASTLARFIDSEHYRLIVNSPDNTARGGRAGIDKLYTQVLMLAFSGVTDAAVFANYRRVLGAIVYAFNPLSRIQVAEILGISPALIATALQHLHSVLLIPSEASEDIRIFHKSFPGFLQDSSRCSDSKFL